MKGEGMRKCDRERTLSHDRATYYMLADVKYNKHPHRESIHLGSLSAGQLSHETCIHCVCGLLSINSEDFITVCVNAAALKHHWERGRHLWAAPLTHLISKDH